MWAEVQSAISDILLKKEHHIIEAVSMTNTPTTLGEQNYLTPTHEPNDICELHERVSKFI